MTETGILFNDAMVRAILAGTKTQTRRVLRQQPLHIGVYTERGREVDWVHVDDDGDPMDGPGITCPYGVPGDRLWVREAWGVRSAVDVTDWHRGTMRGHVEASPGTVVDFRADYGEQREACFWRPSIHMPRWASRLTLEVTDVRVERVKSISVYDARAEGLSTITKDGGRLWKWGIPDRDGLPGSDDDGWHWCEWETDSREAFRKLWDSINGERAGCSWSDDPWVWVVTFRRVEGAR